MGEERVEALKDYNRKVMRHLEKGMPLRVSVLKELKDALSAVVQDSMEWAEVLRGIRDSGEYYCVHLLHPDNEILNLPWSMAVDKISGQALGSIRQLYLTKSIPDHYKETVFDFTAAAPPLKVLIMISMPEDIEEEQRISYEKEEYAVLEAFEPLLRAGLVEIDFTEDGSLEALERKLTSTRFHVLHFFGHGIYDEENQKGFLQLEEPGSLRTELAEDREFADVVNCNPGYRVPLVVLASCQTAKGGNEKALSGVTNHLLRIGVPVVVSMGMSIFDYYAAIFSACFYRNMAERQTIFTAYNEALNRLREAEHDDLVKARVSPAVPLQWIIPNLYLSRPLEGVVDWDQPVESLELRSNRYIFEKDSMLLRHEKEYLFIGRRREKAEILRPFFDKVPIMLNGQGGVGKTAMAEHLVQRLIAHNPRTVPFIFNEKTRTIDEIMETLKNYLREEGKIKVILEADKIEKGLDKFLLLVFEIAENRNPVFVFDNLESFQSKPGEEISDEYGDLREIIDFLCTSRKFHLVLTGRYKVPGFKGLQNFDLNQVGLNDFWKRCIYMDVGHIRTYLKEAEAEEGKREKKQKPPAQPAVSFMDIVKLLHRTFGGNYRALEFFNNLLRENPGGIRESLASLEAFERRTASRAVEVKQQMGQNLLFSQLMEMLDPEQRQVLDLVSHFRVPVQVMALDLQKEGLNQAKAVDWAGVLEYLNRLTLIEISMMSELKAVFYYVTPLVRDLLASLEKAGEPRLFSHEQAGRYYYYCFYNIDKSLTPLEEAFYHFDLSGNRERVQEIGDRLSSFYYDYCIYRSAFFYANRVYELWGDETKGHIINLLGNIYYIQGEFESALKFLHKSLDGCRKGGNKEGEGTTLNNISQIYSARGDYETALSFLEQSLNISREIGDKAGEGTTLNNMATTAYARGDYETALSFLEQSLNISREIGDKAGEGTTLNNMAATAHARGDYETALSYLEQSLNIRREIGDKAGEGTTLNNISQIYDSRGDYETALSYLEQSLNIRRE
nr:tetratricopeptide repeat protein [Candidatus Aminicenantes bacterium]